MGHASWSYIHKLVHHQLFYPGENFFVEDIDNLGSIFLTIAEGQSDLTFFVQDKNMFGFDKCYEFILEDAVVQ